MHILYKNCGCENALDETPGGTIMNNNKKRQDERKK